MTGLHFLDPCPSGHPVVLLLHGLGADGDSWALQVPALEAVGFRPLAPDTPGFGRSAYDRGGWSIRRVAGQMAGLLNEVGGGPAHVVGLSMGGVIAQQLALDFPHLTRKLVLVSTFSFLRPHSWSGWGYFLRRAALVSLRGMDAQARLVAERVFPREDCRPLRERLVDTIRRADPRAYRRAMVSLGTFDSRRRLKWLQVPTLVVTGADDTTVPPARQTLLAAAIPGAVQRLIPQAGHAVPVDQADLFNQLLLEFLKN